MKYLKSFNETFENDNINEFTIDDVFSLIDYSEYKNLYPNYLNDDNEYSDDYKFDSKEQAYSYANNILDIFNSFDDVIIIYRCIHVNKLEDIDYSHLGDCWSFEKSSALEFGSHNNSNVLLIGKIKHKDVNWKESIKCYIQMSGNYSSDDENELNVNCFEVFDVKIEILNKKLS